MVHQMNQPAAAATGRYLTHNRHEVKQRIIVDFPDSFTRQNFSPLFSGDSTGKNPSRQALVQQLVHSVGLEAVVERQTLGARFTALNPEIVNMPGARGHGKVCAEPESEREASAFQATEIHHCPGPALAVAPGLPALEWIVATVAHSACVRQ
jgi:hypothetical protein